MSATKRIDIAKMAVAALLVILSFAAAGYRMAVFDGSNYAVGKDAYFHVIQAKSLVETGRTHAPDYSATPYLLALVYRFAGNWETAQKAMLAVLCGIWTLFTGLTMIRAKKDEYSRKLLILIVWCVPAAFSPSVTVIASQFAKQAAGLAVFAVFLYFLNEALTREGKDRTRLWNWIAAGIAAVAAFFSHRLSGALAFLGLILSLPKKWLVVAAAAGGVLAVLGTFVIPGIFGLSDLQRFAGAFSFVPSFHPVSMFRLQSFNAAWFVESLLPYVYVVVWIVLIAGRKKEFVTHKRFRLHLFLFVCMLIGIFPFYRFDTLDMGYRLFAGTIPLAWAGLYLLTADFTELYERQRVITVSVVLSALFIIGGWGVYRPESDPPYAQYDPLIRSAEVYFESAAVEPEIVIVHHGLSFYYTYVCGRHTLPFEPEWDFDPSRTYRIAYGIEPSEWARWLSPAVQPQPLRLDNDYTLVREDVWQTFASNCSGNAVMAMKVFSAKNPYKTRPDYLSRFREN